MTFKARLTAGLLALGWRSVPVKTRKYEAFGHPQKETMLFVGPSGALRAGKCASDSHSVGSPGMESAYYRMVLEAGDRALADRWSGISEFERATA